MSEVTSSSSFHIIGHSKWQTSCLVVKLSCGFARSVPTKLKDVMFTSNFISCVIGNGNDIYPGSSTHSKVVFREVLHQIELEFKSQF